MVSIVAVFLALAVGIVLGSTVIDEAIVSGLRGSVRELSDDKEALRKQVESLRETTQTDTAFHKAVAPLLLDGRLAGRQVVIVAAPQIDRGVRTGVATMLELADAKVAGSIRLLPKVYDPAAEAEVDDLVSRLVPPGVDLRRPTVPERVAALLGQVLATKGAGAAAPSRSAITALSGLKDAGVVDYETRLPPGESPVVVILVPTPDPNADDVAKASLTRSNAALLAVVDAFSRNAVATVAAASTGGAVDGSVLRSVRTDSTFAARASSVDNVDTDIGRIALVLALDEALRTRDSGHYGTGSGADALSPAAELTGS